MKVEMIFN